MRLPMEPAPLPATPARQHESKVQVFSRLGYAAIVLFVGTFGAWTTMASLSGAVVAPAQLVAESNVKKVQHQAGGVVADIRVRDGQHVSAGDLLLRLDDTGVRTALEIVRAQGYETRARIARLEAERDDRKHLQIPPALSALAHDAELQVVFSGEQRFMAARASARAGLQAQFEKRKVQLQAEMKGALAQLDTRTREFALVSRELEGVRGLQARGMAALTRVNALERDVSAIEAQRAALTSQAAQAESRIAETELQIGQITEDHRAEVLRDLREAQARLAELVQRAAAAEDQFRRIELRAPTDGVVHQLAVHTIGGVINPSEPAMLIVPSDDRLHFEAKVAPIDYDQIHMDQPVRVRVLAFNQRTTPELEGIVTRLSADVTRDQMTGGMFYPVRITIEPAELARIAPLQLKAGMQAEVYIRTGERSPASYLLKPFVDQVSRAFRER